MVRVKVSVSVRVRVQIRVRARARVRARVRVRVKERVGSTSERTAFEKRAVTRCVMAHEVRCAKMHSVSVANVCITVSPKFTRYKAFYSRIHQSICFYVHG